MTAVAPPQTLQPIPSRPGWGGSNGSTQSGIGSMSADEFSRMVMPRRTAQRSNSSTSLSSQASTGSSASTLSSPSVPANGQLNSTADFGTKKRPARNIFPAHQKSEPSIGISNAKTQSVSANTGSSAASAMNALHTPSSMLPSQNGGMPQPQANGVARQQEQNGPAAMLWLSPMNGTFERKQIAVPYYPDVCRIGRQTNNKTQPQPTNGYFDSKVLSRQHAEIWADRSTGKIWIRDVKSSNGTFVNGQRLSPENKDSDPQELREQDVLELGIDIVSEDQKTVVHHKVAAKVEHAGFYISGPLLDLNFGDMDSAASGLLAGAQEMGIRGRSGSQGSMGSASRFGSGHGLNGGALNGVGQQRQPMWLQTITMDQVVKKINTEFKLARQQTQDLQRTNTYIDSLLSPNSNKERPVPPSKSSPIKDLKTRFSDPPAPPPQQPLPEKPDVARTGMDAIIQPFLQRTETERPRLTSSLSSPNKAAPGGIAESNPLQVSALLEALNIAKKELEAHNVRLREVEEMLVLERQARESAEERAQRLEVERNETRSIHEDLQPLRNLEINGSPIFPHTDSSDSDGASDTATLVGDDNIPSSTQQRRLGQVVGEMTEMKMQMENYRARAEKAEEESARDRATLAEMIESVRREEAKRAGRGSSRGRHSPSITAQGILSTNLIGNADTALGSATMTSYATMNGDVTELFRRAGLQNGRPVTPEQVKQLEDAVHQALTATATRHRRGEQLAQVGPYASILGVVFAGVALMAYLNSWQKVDR